jgi:hypothetical protein
LWDVLGCYTDNLLCKLKILKIQHVKRFLRKCWNARADVTLVINEVFGKAYEAGLVVEDEE